VFKTYLAEGKRQIHTQWVGEGGWNDQQHEILLHVN